MSHREWMTAAVLLSLLGCAREPAPKHTAAAEAAPVQVQVVEVTWQPFTAAVAVTGSLVSRSLVEVKAETTGRVERFPKEEGNRVEAGETVVWVNQENYRLALSEAESALKVAEASGARTRLLEQYNQSELERARNLIKSGGITDKDLKAAELAQEDARAQVRLAEAQLAQARVALEVARKRMNDTMIRAPVAGEIQRKHINVGAYVEPPTAVFTLVDNDRLELESFVPSVDLGAIRAGQAVRFTVPAYPSESFTGRVAEVSPAVEADNRSAKVRIQVASSGGKLKAGMFAQGEILTGAEQQAVVIDARALYRDDPSAKQSHVYVVQDGKAVKREVRIGRERETQAEVLSGLQPGELLIARQSIELAEGVRVDTRK